MKCDNVERKCQWKGTVGTLEAHVATCKFTLVPCPKGCKYTTRWARPPANNKKIKYFMRKDLDKHLENDCPNRDHECEYCGEKGTYAHITKVHDEICELKILPCPNECTETMPRQDIEEHVELECEYTVITCKFKNIGCTTEMKRGDMAAHEQNDSLHLSKALDTVVELQEKMSKLESAANTTITFKLTEFRGKCDSDKTFISSSFYTSPGGYHMNIEVDANGYGDGKGTHVAIYAPILKGEYDTELSWPFVGKVTFTLFNQLEDNNHKTNITTLNLADNARVGDNWGFTAFIRHSDLGYNSVKNTQYLKDDSLYFSVSVKVSDHKPWLECTTK